MFIYCATNKFNNKKYIGQTNRSVEERKKEHIYGAMNFRAGCSLFYRALRKYGEEGFEWSILAEPTTREEANRLESYYIEYYNATNKAKGYNLKGGGYAPFLTEEVKSKIGKAQIGELNHMYGKYGKDNPSSKPVYDCTDNKYYNSATECALALGISTSKVCAVCRGERATTGGRVFRYVQNSVICEVPNQCKQKTKTVKNLDTGKVYKSVVEASMDFYGSKKSANKIYNDLRRSRKHWNYI